MLVAIMYGVSVFVGIIAGIGVQIGVEYIKGRKRIKQECENLKFEIICNISKIDKWLESLVDLRNKTNSDRIHEFSGYFNLASTIFCTANRMLQSGTLYKCLSEKNIDKLQSNTTYLSFSGESIINNQFNQHKQAMLSGFYNKANASTDIDSWEQVLKDCKNNFEEIIKELSKK